MKLWKDCTPAEVKAALDHMRLMQRSWGEAFVNAYAEHTEATLDYSLDSIGPAWQLVLDVDVPAPTDAVEQWMETHPGRAVGLTHNQAWAVTWFSGYWTQTIKQLVPTSWAIGPIGNWSHNQPLFVVGGAENLSRPGQFGRFLAIRKSSEFIVEQTALELELAGQESIEWPLYQVVISEGKWVELSYRFSEDGNNPKYWAFFDNLREMFVVEFGPGQYQEHYDDSFVVHVPASDLKKAKQRVESIAERAGPPPA